MHQMFAPLSLPHMHGMCTVSSSVSYTFHFVLSQNYYRDLEKVSVLTCMPPRMALVCGIGECLLENLRSLASPLPDVGVVDFQPGIVSAMKCNLVFRLVCTVASQGSACVNYTYGNPQCIQLCIFAFSTSERGNGVILEHVMLIEMILVWFLHFMAHPFHGSSISWL